MENFPGCLWKILWKTWQVISSQNLEVKLLRTKQNTTCGNLGKAEAKKNLESKKYCSEVILKVFSAKNFFKMRIVSDMFELKSNFRAKQKRARRFQRVRLLLNTFKKIILLSERVPGRLRHKR